MGRTRLIGNYGKFAKMTLGAEVGTGTTLTADTWYVPTTIDPSTTMPTGVALKYLFKAVGTETLATTDTCKPVTFADLCDIQSWGLEFSNAEVDVTTLCDDVNTFLTGRTDVTGSAEGVYTIGTTDVDGGFLNNFISIVRQAGAGGVISIDAIDDSAIVAVLYKQELTTSGETEQFYVVPAVVTSFSDSVTGTDAQSFSSSFRPTVDDEVNFQLVSITYS